MLILGMRYSVKNDDVYIYEKDNIYRLSAIYPDSMFQSVTFDITSEGKTYRFSLQLNSIKRIGNKLNIQLVSIDDTIIRVGFMASREEVRIERVRAAKRVKKDSK